MSTFYLDYDLGNDSTTATPLGWWSVTFTLGMGPAPVVGEFAEGVVSGSTARVTAIVLSSGSWDIGSAAGTMYFYGKSAAFQAEDVIFDSGYMTIAADFTYCAWKTITSGATAARIAPADIIRIAKSPDTVSLGVNGIWTTAPTTLPTSKNITSSTNASPISLVIAAHGAVTGDIVYIQNHTTNLTANGSWICTRVDDNTLTLDGSLGVGIGGATGNCTVINWMGVKLASALTKRISRCERPWTAAGAATVTLDAAQYKEGDASVKVVKASPANSTLYAYMALLEGAPVNFASYQKVSFWIFNATAITANQWDLCLCSDTAGATVVDTIAIPAIPSTSQWTVLTIARNGGGNLGNSIQSVALYSGSSTGTTTGIYLDNITACTTSGLNLQSLISKNSAAQGGAEGFYGIQSISEDGKVVRLDNHTNCLASAGVTTRGYGYSGMSETVTAYKRETIKTALASVITTQVQVIQDSGTLESNIQFQGGFDPVTNLQNGETFFDGLNGWGLGLYIGGKSYTTIAHLALFRYYYAVDSDSSSRNTHSFTNLNNNGHSGLYLTGTGNSVTTVSNANNNYQYGVYSYISPNNQIIVDNSISNNTDRGAFFTYSGNSFLSGGSAINNGGYAIGFSYAALNKIKNILTARNGIGGISESYETNYASNVLIEEATEVAGFSTFGDSRLFSHNHDQTADNHWIFTDGGTINSLATTREGGTGIMWKLAITSSNRASSYPLILSIAKIAVSANNLVTVKAYLKKDHATDVVGKLICRGGQIAGIASDLVATKANDTNWEELTISGTPTVAGVIEIECWAEYSAGNSNIYVEDLTISQN